MKFLIIFLLFCSVAYAMPNLEATGNDYILMNDDQKTALVNKLYMIFKADKNKKAPEDAVVELDNFYSLHQKKTDKESEALLNSPVMKVLAVILTYEPKKKQS